MDELDDLQAAGEDGDQHDHREVECAAGARERAGGAVLADAEPDGGHERHHEGKGARGQERQGDQPRPEQGADGGGGGVHGRSDRSGPLRVVPYGARRVQGEALQPRSSQQQAAGGEEPSDQASRLHYRHQRSGRDDHGLRQGDRDAELGGASFRRGVRTRDYVGGGEEWFELQLGQRQRERGEA